MDRATRHTRRAALRLAGGGLALGGIALLEACGPSAAPSPTAAPAAPQPTTAPKPTTASVSVATSAPQPTTAAAPAAAAAQPTTQPGLVPGQLPVSKSVTLPTRVPIQVVPPDFPGSADGLVDPGYINYPSNPFKAVADKPGTGGDVTVATWTLAPPPTPMESNALWQEVNKQLGVTLKLNINSLVDYQTTKLATIIAGDDLPDILYIAPGTAINGLTQFLQAKCTDLTQYLSGDAVKDYPNLANFSNLSWQSVIFNKAIYGVPSPYPLFLWGTGSIRNCWKPTDYSRRRTWTTTPRCSSTTPTRSRTCTVWQRRTPTATASRTAFSPRCTVFPTTGVSTPTAS
jgi:hypothetical protein